jgi:hypothetical protein
MPVPSSKRAGNSVSRVYRQKAITHLNRTPRGPVQTGPCRPARPTDGRGATDQKVGGSTPSERAELVQVRPYSPCGKPRGRARDQLTDQLRTTGVAVRRRSQWLPRRSDDSPPQRNHQRVPPSSLNDFDYGQPTTTTSASTRPPPNTHADVNVSDVHRAAERVSGTHRCA